MPDAIDPWAEFPTVDVPAAGHSAGPVYGEPAKVDPYRAEDQGFQRSAEARAAAASERSRIEWQASHNPDGSKKAVQGTNAIPDSTAKRTEGNMATFTGLQRSAETFQDDFGGNPIGGIENWAQQYVDVGTPGQRGWWSEFKALDNQIRNDLFGSALTATEKAAYEQTTVEPGMRPEIIRENLNRRGELIGDVLERQRQFLIANGNKPEAVDALFAPILERQKALQIGASAPQDGDSEREKSAAYWGQDVFGADGRPLGPDGGEAFDRMGKSLGLYGSVTDDTPLAPLSESDRKSPLQDRDIAVGKGVMERVLGAPIAAGIGDVAEGAGDILGIFANPLNATTNAMTGSDLTTDMGGHLRDLTGAPDGDPMISAINEAGTAALTGSLAGRGAAALAQPGLIQDAARVIGSSPVTDTLAGAAGGAGSEIARENGSGPLGQIAAGILAGSPVAAARGLGTRPARVATPLAEAAERQSVDLMPADTGSAVAGRLTGGLAQSPISAGPLTSAARRSQDQLGDAAGRVARSQAPAATSESAGDSIRSAAERFSSQTSQRGGRLYARAEQRAAGVSIPPTRAVATIDSYLDRLSELGGTNGPLIQELQTLRGDIANGASVAALRDLRTTMRGNTAPGGQLRSDQQQHMYREIVDDLSHDIEIGLRRAGKGSAAMSFRAADTYWKNRVEQIDQVLQPIIGRDGTKGGEQIVSAIEAMSQGRFGGNQRVSKLLSNMEPDEAAGVRAIIIDRLGKATPGQQNAAGDAFSASTFLSNWNRITPQAKATLFGVDTLRKDLDDIATIAEGARGAARYANHSNTGSANFATAGFYGLAGAADFQTAATMAALQYGTARLMASPSFARWLAKAPATNAPGTIRLQIDMLGKLAAREAAITGDAQALQQQLREAFAQSPVRAAAGEKEQDGRAYHHSNRAQSQNRGRSRVFIRGGLAGRMQDLHFFTPVPAHPA